MTELTMRQQLEGMALAYDAAADPNYAGSIQFVVTGDEAGQHYLCLRKGAATFHDGRLDQPTLTITTSADVWRKVSSGEMQGAQALLDGAYAAEGDLHLLLRMPTLFRTAATLDLSARRRPPGPLPIGGMAYMHLIFAAWIAHLFSFNWPGFDRLMSYAIAAVVTVFLALYRSAFNRPTTLEILSAAYFTTMIAAFPLVPAFLATWGSAISLAVMASTWLLDMARGREPLSATYSKWHFVPEMERFSGFRHTNFVISLFWGAVITFQLAVRILSVQMPTLHYPLLAVELGVLIPAILFTARYPKGAATRRIESMAETERHARGLARMLLAGGVLLLLFGILLGAPETPPAMMSA